MSMNQDTAILIDTLASAAAKLSFTHAGKQIEAQIIAMIPGAAESVTEALRQDNIELQTSSRIMAENLEILRGKLADIHALVTEALMPRDIRTAPPLGDALRQIQAMTAPIADEPAA